MSKLSLLLELNRARYRARYTKITPVSSSTCIKLYHLFIQVTILAPVIFGDLYYQNLNP